MVPKNWDAAGVDSDYKAPEIGSGRLDSAKMPGEVIKVPAGKEYVSATFVPGSAVGRGGAPTRASTIPDDAAGRKRHPVQSGFLDYFPDAVVAVSHVSYMGNEQHNPGQPLHWSRGKSGDHADALQRHMLNRGSYDKDGIRHSAKVAWRALAMLQEEIEAEQRQFLTVKDVVMVKGEPGQVIHVGPGGQVARESEPAYRKRMRFDTEPEPFRCPQDGEANCCPNDAESRQICEGFAARRKAKAAKAEDTARRDMIGRVS